MASEPRVSERRACSLLAHSPRNFELLLAARSRYSKISKVILSFACPQAISETFRTLVVVVVVVEVVFVVAIVIVVIVSVVVLVIGYVVIVVVGVVTALV